MAQAQSLYVDTYSGDFVAGANNTTIVAPPKFTQGDTKNFKIYLLERTSTFPASNPYSIINNANLSLKVALGPKDGTAGSTLYTQQFTWTKDAANQYFSGAFPLNTSGITTLLGANATATAWFEIEYTEAGLPTTPLSKLVTVEAEVIETGSITVPAGQTALSAEEANATFLKRKISGAIYLEDINNPGQFIALYNENGVFKADAVSGVVP